MLFLDPLQALENSKILLCHFTHLTSHHSIMFFQMKKLKTNITKYLTTNQSLLQMKFTLHKYINVNKNARKNTNKFVNFSILNLQ